ncbi:MAG: hypothetical protein N2Z85_01660, partial [Patescibacteria group bacterium]|nr:hypothetical protein [Patescibacteria group bacterium]
KTNDTNHDLVLARYDASGNFIGAPLTFRNSNGWIGFGTQSPSHYFHFVTPSGVSQSIRIETQHTGGDFKIGGYADVGFYTDSAAVGLRAPSGGLVFLAPYNAGASSGLALSSSSNVGIGVLNPLYKLSVVGASQFVISGEETIQFRGVIIQPVQSTGSSPHQINGWGNNSGLQLRALPTATGNPSASILIHPNGNIIFSTNTGHAIGVERMRITGDGNVGIGTTNPTDLLDINGSNGYSQLRLRTTYTPTNSSDTNGEVGDIAWDSNYIYIKTSAGWKRAPLSSW